MDATRFDQFGTWEGILHTPDGDIRVDPESSRGTKDRSWGVRAVGEPEGGGAPVTPKGIAFMWAPLFWEDHVSHAIFFDGPEGRLSCARGSPRRFTQTQRRSRRRGKPGKRAWPRLAIVSATTRAPV